MAKKRTILIPRIEDINISPDTSCMHPILEDNTLVCLHGGRVKLKAKKAKRIKSDNVPIMSQYKWMFKSTYTRRTLY